MENVSSTQYSLRLYICLAIKQKNIEVDNVQAMLNHKNQAVSYSIFFEFV